jgi:hypothetical protein
MSPQAAPSLELTLMTRRRALFKALPAENPRRTQGQSSMTLLPNLEPKFDRCTADRVRSGSGNTTKTSPRGNQEIVEASAFHGLEANSLNSWKAPIPRAVWGSNRANQ